METTKKVMNAHSKRNGIIFYSNLIPEVGIETFFDDEGRIQKRLVPKNLKQYEEYLGTVDENNIKVNKAEFTTFNIVLILFSVFIAVIYQNFRFITASIYFSIFVTYNLLTFIKNVKEFKSKNGEGYSTAKFHAAEHMVINAYEKLQRIPTLEETKKFSRFSKKCGSRVIISNIFLFSTISLEMAFLSGWIGLLSIGIVLIFWMIEKRINCLRFLQIFVTNKPSDKELELAIEGVQQFEILEENFSNEEGIFFMLEIPIQRMDS